MEKKPEDDFDQILAAVKESEKATRVKREKMALLDTAIDKAKARSAEVEAAIQNRAQQLEELQKKLLLAKTEHAVLETREQAARTVLARKKAQILEQQKSVMMEAMGLSRFVDEIWENIHDFVERRKIEDEKVQQERETEVTLAKEVMGLYQRLEEVKRNKKERIQLPAQSGMAEQLQPETQSWPDLTQSDQAVATNTAVEEEEEEEACSTMSPLCWPSGQFETEEWGELRPAAITEERWCLTPGFQTAAQLLQKNTRRPSSIRHDEADENWSGPWDRAAIMRAQRMMANQAAGVRRRVAVETTLVVSAGQLLITASEAAVTAGAWDAEGDETIAAMSLPGSQF